MGKKWLKFMGLKYLIKIVDRKMFFPYGKMIRIRIELNTVNGCFFLKFLNDFIHSVINDIDSTLLSS